MTADQYLQQLVAAITAPTGASGPGPTVLNGLRPAIQQWATTQLNELQLSGSYMKGTAITGGTDVDLFISLKSDTNQTLREIYSSLGNYMQKLGYSVRRQNVAIGITYGSWKVDLTPGKQQQPWLTNHSIWVSRQQTWQMTNVGRHIQMIGGSGKTDVIRLMKRWRDCHRLAFQSFAVELSVLKALGTTPGSLSNSVLEVLRWLDTWIERAALMDPANTNNNVATELTLAEKRAIKLQAQSSLAKATWGEVVW